MSDYFTFRFSEPEDCSRRSLVIYLSSRVDLDVIAKALKFDVTNNLVPKNVYIMSFQETSVTRKECMDDDSFVGEFNSYVGEINSSLFCLSVDKRGGLFFCDGSPVPDSLSGAILHLGMVALFKKHSGLVVSNHGYHFAKPSGDHCDKFIRASNLLVSSLEVSFLAISLLPYLRRDLKRIYVDTSSISFLASIAIQLFEGFEGDLPSIESFASYAVLNEPFDFVEDRSSLLLISATTSGSLTRNLLHRTSFSNDQIVTVFHVNLPVDQLGVFDVSEAIKGGIVSRSSADCEFCRLGSKLIRIAGDQFVPENPKHELLVIRKDDFTRRRKEFFRQFAAKEVLLWNAEALHGEDAKEHFFLAVDRALEIEAKPFSDVLKKNLKRYLVRDLSTVITFDDGGSRVLERKVRECLGDDAETVDWLKPVDLEDDSLQGGDSVLVLAGAITSGRSLLAVSRKLRGIDPSASIVYFVAFSKLPNDEVYKQLEKDLKQGGHSLVVLNHCPVPRVKEHTKTAWDWEREVLQPFGDDDPFGECGEMLPGTLLARRNWALESSKDSQQLFLPDSKGQPLKLRRTFAFWTDLGFSNERLSESSQSDVYWTIQCVLHDLRNASENMGLATTYHTTLISPANFDRYNDGVIQACLLRSAHPVEMDYRVDSIFSRQMTDVILSVLNNWRNTQGEAALEFLMALWTRRVRLNDDHLEEIVSLIEDDTMTEELNFILKKLSEQMK